MIEKGITWNKFHAASTLLDGLDKQRNNKNNNSKILKKFLHTGINILDIILINA